MGDGMTFPGQHEERRLKGVFGVVMIPEDPAADAPHHRTVTPDEGLERRLFSIGGEPFQESPIRISAERPDAEEYLEATTDNLHPDSLPYSRPASIGLYLYTTGSRPAP